MIETVKAWQCIGCGKIGGAADLRGRVRERKVELVYADEHRAEMARLQTANDAMVALLRQFAHVTPRKGA